MRLRISELRDPGLFQRLVRKLMIAERGKAYQVVDDAGGDGGLDGFDRESGELHAIYCPEKPGTARYREKFRSDLEKAAKLRSNGYAITKFVFITPAPMREPDQQCLRDEAMSAGFEDGINIGEEHLEVSLAQHPELWDHFPELTYPDVSGKLGEILDALRDGHGVGRRTDARVPGLDEEAAPEPQPFTIGLYKNVDSPHLLRLQDRVLAGDQTALTDLEQFRFECDSPEVILAALGVEAEHYWRVGQFDDIARVGREGVTLAARLGLVAEESAFRVHVARALVIIGSGIDLDGAAEAVVSIVGGVRIVEPEELEARSKRVQGIYSEADEQLRLAFQRAGESRNLDAMYFVLMGYASTKLHKAQPTRMLRHIGHRTEAMAEARQAVLSSHSTAVRIARMIGPERHAQALHNYANDLRLLGEPERALPHAQRAMSLAEQLGANDQVELSRRLIALLRSDLARKAREDRANDT